MILLHSKFWFTFWNCKAYFYAFKFKANQQPDFILFFHLHPHCYGIVFLHSSQKILQAKKNDLMATAEDLSVILQTPFIILSVTSVASSLCIMEELKKAAKQTKPHLSKHDLSKKS